MHTPTQDELPRYLKAWRTNQQPRLPEEFDALVSLFDTNDKPMRTKARIRWNGLQSCYEMDPVIITRDTVYDMVDLVLSPDNFQSLTKELLPQIGITAFHRIYCEGAPKETKQPNLPASCFPTIVRIP